MHNFLAKIKSYERGKRTRSQEKKPDSRINSRMVKKLWLADEDYKITMINIKRWRKIWAK